MIIGYVIGGQDIDEEFFKDAPPGVLCPECGICLDPSYVPEKINIPLIQKHDVLVTFDHRFIYSRRVVEFLSLENYSILYKKISTFPEYFYLFPFQIVSFDAITRKTKFGKLCKLCGNSVYAAGATPAYLKTDILPGKGFFRTDIMFGDGQRRGWLTVIDPDLKIILERKSFNGLFFDPAYSLGSPWPPEKK